MFLIMCSFFKKEEGNLLVKSMHVEAHLVEGLRFDVTATSGHSITLSSGEQNAGPSPMEMLLAALAGCTGIGVIGILRKMRQDVIDYQVRVHGERSGDYPQIFTHITVEHIVTGRGVRAEAVQRAIDLDIEHYCSVHAMLSKAATIVHTFQIQEPAEG